MVDARDLWNQAKPSEPRAEWAGEGDGPAYRRTLPPPRKTETEAFIRDAPDGPGMTEAMLSGAASGLTNRLQPVLAGAIGATVSPALFPESVRARYADQDEPEASSWLERYRRERDSAIAGADRLRAASPKAFGAAELAGDIAREGVTAAMTGGASATPLGQGLTGFIGGAAESKEDLTTLSPKALVGAGARGLVTGGLAAGGSHLGNRYGGVIARKAGDIAEPVMRWGQEGAAKAAGAIKQHFKALGGLDKVRQLGQDLLDSGIVSTFASKEDVLDRALALSDDAGGRMGQILSTLDEATSSGFDWNRAAGDVYRRVAEMNPAEAAIIEPVMRDVLGYLKAGRDRGGGFALANAIKSTVQKTIGKYSQDPTVRFELGNAIAGILKDTIDSQVEQAFGRVVRGVAEASSPSLTQEAAQQVEKVAGKSILERWLAAKRDYGIAQNAERLANHGLAQEWGNRWVTPSSYGSGIAAYLAAAQANPERVLTNAAIGGAAGLANKAALKYGRSATSTGARALGEGLERLSKSPGAARAIGGIAGGLAGRKVADEVLGTLEGEVPQAMLERVRQGLSVSLTPEAERALADAASRGPRATLAALGAMGLVQ